MKTIITIIFAIVIYSAQGQDTLSNVSGPHGGRLKLVQNYNVEVLGSYRRVITYLFDKDLKPISNKGINGSILFFYADNASLNVKLKPYETNGFYAEVSAVDYFYCVVNLTIYGKTISSKFDNLSDLAKKEKKELK
jgi:hypothetical protein